MIRYEVRSFHCGPYEMQVYKERTETLYYGEVLACYYHWEGVRYELPVYRVPVWVYLSGKRVLGIGWIGYPSREHGWEDADSRIRYPLRVSVRESHRR